MFFEVLDLVVQFAYEKSLMKNLLLYIYKDYYKWNLKHLSITTYILISLFGNGLFSSVNSNFLLIEVVVVL